MINQWYGEVEMRQSAIGLQWKQNAEPSSMLCQFGNCVSEPCNLCSPPPGLKLLNTTTIDFPEKRSSRKLPRRLKGKIKPGGNTKQKVMPVDYISGMR